MEPSSVLVNGHRVSRGILGSAGRSDPITHREQARHLLSFAANDAGVMALLRQYLPDHAFAFRLSDNAALELLAREIERGTITLERLQAARKIATPARTYPQLSGLMRKMNRQSPEEEFDNKIIPYLAEVWLDDYTRTYPKADIVECNAAGFYYLFDIATERLIAAWGISQGRHGGARDKSRMAGHPNSAGALYHRGHAIPHTLGGITDINLVPQLGKINVGPFRPLERQAVATPGSLYFTYWTYFEPRPAKNRPPRQTPTGVDQGLLIPGQWPQITRHGN